MSELVAEMSDQEFDQLVLQGGDAYLVDFWGPRCGPCGLIAPIVAELAVEYSGKLKVSKINVESHQEVAIRFGVSAIPTLMIFKNGELKERITGAVPKATLQQAIDKVV